MIDYYELLGIKENATDQEIKIAYKQMVKKYHPDVNKTKEANKIIVSLNEAKEILLDNQKRKEYDLLLNKIKHSKQTSKNRNETYSANTQEYRQKYSHTYITKWQFLINYLVNGLDSKWLKFIKCMLIAINFILFLIIKLITICVVYTLCILENFIDFFAGVIIILAVLSLFVLTKETMPNHIPFIPNNIENFLIFSTIAGIIEIIKTLIIKKSINLYVFFQNIEDKIFVSILMK